MKYFIICIMCAIIGTYYIIKGFATETKVNLYYGVIYIFIPYICQLFIWLGWCRTC